MKKPVDTVDNNQVGDFRLEDFLPFRLSVAADAVSRLMVKQYLARLGLGMAEWRLLAAVGRFGILSPSATGEQTSMDKVKVSRAAASLIARGLIRQTQDPDDGRGRHLRLTRKGTTLCAAIGPMATNIEHSLSSGLSKTEWTQLHKALGKLNEHARSLQANDSEDGPD